MLRRLHEKKYEVLKYIKYNIYCIDFDFLMDAAAVAFGEYVRFDRTGATYKHLSSQNITNGILTLTVM